MTKEFYNTKEIASLLQITEKTVRKLIKDSKLKAKKVCRKWIITQESFNNFMNSD